MALISLLIAILVERLKLLPENWQFDNLMSYYQRTFFGDKQLAVGTMMILALSLPTIITWLMMWVFEGWLWGAVTLCIWIGSASLCFCHQQQRSAFKSYIQAASRGDVQACYHFANELDSHSCADSSSEAEMGASVGKSVAWINYRYYGAVALYLVFFGPIGVVLYCTVRHYAEYGLKQNLNMPIVDPLLFVLDWLPSRIFAFGYVLSGQFSQGFTVWRKKAFSITGSARGMVTEVALSAEDLPEVSPAPICVQSTLALLQLSKRNFMLLVTALSLLTIFGLVS